MHEADDAYSIRSTWSCYWLDQFLTLGTQYIDFVDFLHFNGSVYQLFCSFIRSFVLFLKFHLFFSFLHFSLLTIALSQPLTSFYFLWVLCSYSFWFFHYLLCFQGFTLWFFHYLIFFCHFISIFCLYNTLDCSQS